MPCLIDGQSDDLSSDESSASPILTISMMNQVMKSVSAVILTLRTSAKTARSN